jgi:hypothetical protein
MGPGGYFCGRGRRNANANANSNGNANTDGDGNADSDSDADCNSDSNRNAYSYSEGDTDLQAASNAGASSIVRNDANVLLAQIVTLPRRFHSLGNVSMFSLLEATGYFELHDQISEGDIRAALLHCPECIEEWMQYSEDKRTSSGWYVTQDDEGCYETGYIADASTRTKRIQYESLVDACAFFIKHEIEEIRLA